MNIDDYEVQETIGQGGMGTVVRAIGADGSVVALKLLLNPRPDRVRRFQREQRLLTKLGRDAGFVPILGSGESKLGPYLVMPYLSGGSLKDRLAKKKKLPVKEAVRIAITIGRAMGKAHRKGIVHRDLKPDNVLFDKESNPYVADLGLAKHFRDRDVRDTNTRVSTTGEARGTVGYMSPEQIRDSKSVGPECDVFALGAILFECVTGKPAFPSASQVQILATIAAGEHKGLDAFPKWLRGAVRKSLAFEPKDRPHDGHAFARSLEKGGDDGAGSPWRRRRFAIYAGILLGALASAYVMGWLSVERLRALVPDAIAPVTTR